MNKVIGATIGAVAIAGALIVGYLDYNTSKYICKNCGHEYRPTPVQWTMGMHFPGRRHLKCPNCGNWGWHRRIMDWELDPRDFE